MNRQFDVIVIGDSKAGSAAVKSIAGASRNIKVAFISSEFKRNTTRDFLNVEYIKNNVVYTDYNNRLFCCYLASGERHYCTHLIIASGISYAPFMIGNKQINGVFNTIDEMPKATKNQVAIVVGGREIDAKLALAVAKKYKYVYLCTKSMELDIKEATQKKLEATENLLMLQNASITKAMFAEDSLVSVSLDSYAKITCNAIFAITTPAPETSFVSDKLISKDENGYLKTTDIAQSLFVPKCFAIGNCACKSTKKMHTAMIESVLKDFNGG